MKPKTIAFPLVSFVLSVLFFAMTFLTDARPPEELQFISGAIVDPEALYTKGRITGFRFHVGHPLVTFTYRDPDPDVERAWATIQTARSVRVRFDEHTDRHPTLWALEADGKPIATQSELETSRARWYWLYFWAAVIAAGIGFASAWSLWKARSQPRRRDRRQRT